MEKSLRAMKTRNCKRELDKSSANLVKLLNHLRYGPSTSESTLFPSHFLLSSSPFLKFLTFMYVESLTN